MATGKNGYFDLTGTKGFSIRIKWSEEWDVATNTSKVSIDALYVKSTEYSDAYYLDGTLKINGVTAITFDSVMGTHSVRPTNSTGFFEVGNNSGYKPAPWTVNNIVHNDDGSKNVVIAADIAGYTISGANGNAWKVSGSSTVVLTTIARASQPSCITWPTHTQNVGEFGDEISIHMNRKSDVFTHTVRYQFGSKSGTIATGVETGVKWTIPLSLMDLIPAATSGSGTIYVDTYNGSTKIGTKYCGFTAKVPSSVTPVCRFTLEDISGADDIYGSPVKGLSRIKITVNVTEAYSSPIASCVISANGVNYSGLTATTDFLKESGTSRVTAKVKDKRGRSASVTYDMTVQDYTPPVITALSVMRCNADGTRNKRGSHVKVTFSAAVSSMGGKNTAAYSLKYKKTSDSEYTEVPLSELANNFAPKNSTYIFAANTGNSYDVVLLAVDRHNANDPATKSAKAPTASAIFSWRGFKGSSGIEDGAGIGKVPEKANTLQVGWNAEFDKDVVCKGNNYIFSSTGATGLAGYVRMAQLTHIGSNADTPITFVFTRGLETAPMTVHVRFKGNTGTVDPDLDCITYEGNNYGAFIVHASESVWDLYVKKRSAYDEITLQRWFSSATISDMLAVAFPGDHVSDVPNGLDGYFRATPAKMQSLLDFIYPVGSIYLSYSHVSPETLFGGAWVRIENAFLWGVDSSGTIGLTGGEKTHALTVNELPVHTHGAVYSQNAAGDKTQAWFSTSGDKLAYGTVSAGGGQAHNNMPPYIQVSIWRRTA